MGDSEVLHRQRAQISKLFGTLARLETPTRTEEASAIPGLQDCAPCACSGCVFFLLDPKVSPASLTYSVGRYTRLEHVEYFCSRLSRSDTSERGLYSMRWPFFDT